MTFTLHNLLHDEHGFVVSTELAAVATLLVVGAAAGLNGLRESAVGEMQDVASALKALDQSYAYGRGELVRDGRRVPTGWRNEGTFVYFDDQTADPAVPADPETPAEPNVRKCDRRYRPCPVEAIDCTPYEAVGQCYGRGRHGWRAGACGYRFPPAAVMGCRHGDDDCCCDHGRSECGDTGCCRDGCRSVVVRGPCGHAPCGSGCSAVIESPGCCCSCSPPPALPPRVCPPISLYCPDCTVNADDECHAAVAPLPCTPCAPSNCRVIW